MDKKYWNYLRILFGFFILFLLFYKIGLAKIITTLVHMNLWLVLVAISFYLIFFLISTFNILILTNCINPKIRFITLLKYYFLSWSIGLLAPGKIGEFSLVYFLKKEGIPIGKGIVIPFIDKIITAITLSIIALIGILIFPGFDNSYSVDIIIVIALIFLGFSFFFSELGRTLLKKYVLRKYAKKFAGFSNTLKLFIRDKKAILLVNLIMTLLGVFIMGVIYYLLFLSIGQNINLFYIIMVNSLGTIIAMVPITISGLGVREIAAVFLYSLIGISPEATATVYIILTIINYLNASINFFLNKAG